MSGTLRLSTLAHTWLIDLDGVVVRHNGHLEGGDALLPGVRDFWASIPAGDRIVLLSARDNTLKPAALAFLQTEGLRVDHAIFGLPKGERILINDQKPGGLETAVAVNLGRDAGLADTPIVLSHEL